MLSFLFADGLQSMRAAGKGKIDFLACFIVAHVAPVASIAGDNSYGVADLGKPRCAHACNAQLVALLRVRVINHRFVSVRFSWVLVFRFPMSNDRSRRPCEPDQQKEQRL